MPPAAAGPRGQGRPAASRQRKEQFPESTSKKPTQRQGFKTNEFIVYPAHGVGQIMAIEEQEVAGAKLELFVINFVKDKMTLACSDGQGRQRRHAQARRSRRWSSARWRR